MSDLTFATTGDFYSHQVERRIFHPLGMESATYGRAALESSTEWARPPVRGGRGWRVVPVRDSYYRVPPAAGVNASIEDVAKWMLAHLGHKPEVLPAELLATLHTPRVTTPGEGATSPWRRARVRHAQYALGWRVYDYAGEPLIFHAGAVQGYRGMIGMLPNRDFGVALLWNCESAAPSGLLPTLLDAYLGLPERTWVAVEDDDVAPAAAPKARTKAGPRKAVPKPKATKRRRTTA
jgi:beta-lactamase class C